MASDQRRFQHITIQAAEHGGYVVHDPWSDRPLAAKSTFQEACAAAAEAYELWRGLAANANASDSASPASRRPVSAFDTGANSGPEAASSDS